MNQENIDQKKDLQKDLKKLESLEKAAVPLWLTKKYVDKPCQVITVCSIVFLICVVLTGAFGLLAQSDQNQDREWRVWSNEKVIERDIWLETQKFFKKQTEGNNIPVRSEEIEIWQTSVILECYKDCDDNVITSKQFSLLRKAENAILNMPKFKDFCLATPEDPACSEGSLVSISDTFTSQQLENLSTSDLVNKLKDILSDDELSIEYNHLLGNEFTQNNNKSQVLRSIFNFGGPLEVNGKKYKSRYDRELEQNEAFEDFTKDIIDLIDDLNDQGDGKVVLLLFSEPSINIQLLKTVNNDFLWALASIVFVWCYLTFHLKSFFLSSFSMLNIIMSFPITLTIVRLMFQVDYFSTLHILVVFIVLGIAADDVFVFQDAWIQTTHYPTINKDLNKRMAVTFRRASKAMLATSSTTSAAFLATGMSPIMPISSFGIFAGILIPVNYILVITFYPAIVIVHYKYFIDKCCCKQQKPSVSNKKDSQKHIPTQVESNLGTIIRPSQAEVYEVQSDNKKSSLPALPPAGAGVINATQGEAGGSNIQIPQQKNTIKSLPQIDEEEEPKKISKIEEFFGTKFNTFVFKAKYFIIAFFAIWTGIAIWRALNMGPQTEPDQWLPDDYELQRATNHLTYSFKQGGQSDYTIEVAMVIGPSGIDQEGTAQWDASDVGKIQFDSSFDLSPPTNQQHLYNFCKNLKTNNLVLDGVVNCFMLEFYTFITNGDVNPENFPVPQNQFLQKIQEFIDDPSSADFYYSSHIGLYNGKLNYVAFTATAKGDPLDGYEDQEKREEKWQNLIDNYNKNAPSGINKMRQSSDIWSWMITYRTLVNQAFFGMLISLAFALLVLIFSTHNIVVSLYSILSITGIVVSVVTIMELSGWQMGIAESITVVILIGFSVDYVVHLANHYVESSYNDRFSRTQEALQEIGISIISGAITTLGSGIFLFFAVVSIFSKFAVLIVSTISFSLLFSLLFFASMMHAFGPQNQFGNIFVICRKKTEKVGSEKNLSQRDSGELAQQEKQQEPQQQQQEQQIEIQQAEN